MTDIVDPDDGCTVCKGKGETPPRLTQRGTYMPERCDVCRGTGSRTIRVTPTPKERKAE